MQSNERLAARVMELELQLMHLQKDYDALNQMVLRQGAALDELTRSLQQLSRKSVADDQSIVERNPLDEKPPHY